MLVVWCSFFSDRESCNTLVDVRSTAFIRRKFVTHRLSRSISLRHCWTFLGDPVDHQDLDF